MKRVVNATNNSTFFAADMDAAQDRALGLSPLDTANDFTAYADGCLGGSWQPASAMAADTLLLIDKSFDWRDREVWGTCFANEGADNNRIGQSTDYNVDSLVSGSNPFDFYGYTGTGAYSTTASATAVSAGNPPVRGAATVRSYFVNLNGSAGALMLYVDPSTGNLYLYNHTGFAVSPILVIQATGQTKKRS